jgi:hypothetical protein
MKTISEALALIKENRKTFNWINIGYFTTVLFGMVIVRASPELQQTLVNMIGEAFTTGPMQYVSGAYSNGEAVAAIGLTFIINLLVGCFVSITMPSLIIPFSGFLIGGLRALLWGIIFSPDLGDLSFTMIILGIGIGLLLVFEGEAYVLALFAAFMHGRAWLKPASIGAATHAQGYLAGVHMSLRLYLLMIGVLLIAAVYEVVLAIWLIPALT